MYEARKRHENYGDCESPWIPLSVSAHAAERKNKDIGRSPTTRDLSFSRRLAAARARARCRLIGRVLLLALLLSGRAKDRKSLFDHLTVRASGWRAAHKILGLDHHIAPTGEKPMTVLLQPIWVPGGNVRDIDHNLKTVTHLLQVRSDRVCDGSGLATIYASRDGA